MTSFHFSFSATSVRSRIRPASTSSSAWRPWLNWVAPIGSPPVMRLTMIGARRAAAAGDGAVDPLVAGGVERLGEFGDRGSLAARRPPMGDFEIGGVRQALRDKIRGSGEKL
jgi:hypothetical protein